MNATTVDVRSRGNCTYIRIVDIEVLNIQQAVTADKGEDVTVRNLTVKDLLSQLHHYNENVRKSTFSAIMY